MMTWVTSSVILYDKNNLCIWTLLLLIGVFSTSVGYTGGSTDSPSYYKYEHCVKCQGLLFLKNKLHAKLFFLSSYFASLFFAFVLLNFASKQNEGTRKCSCFFYRKICHPLFHFSFRFASFSFCIQNILFALKWNKLN